MAFSAFVNYNLETFMSKLYIKLIGNNGFTYLCYSVDDACLVARYLARTQATSPKVESNCDSSLIDFKILTHSYFQPKEVSHG